MQRTNVLEEFAEVCEDVNAFARPSKTALDMLGSIQKVLRTMPANPPTYLKSQPIQTAPQPAARETDALLRDVIEYQRVTERAMDVQRAAMERASTLLARLGGDPEGGEEDEEDEDEDDGYTTTTSSSSPS